MGYLGRKTTQQKGESDTLGGATEHKKGFGSQTAALVHFCAHILFGGLSTTPAPPSHAQDTPWLGQGLEGGGKVTTQ